MPIYRKFSASPGARGPTTLSDIPGLSPIAIQAGESGYSFIATLQVSGLTVPSFPKDWGIVFRIMHGETVLSSHYMGPSNGPWQPSFNVVGVGDVAGTGATESIHAKWQVFGGVTAIIKEQTSFSIVWDLRLD